MGIITEKVNMDGSKIVYNVGNHGRYFESIKEAIAYCRSVCLVPVIRIAV